MSFWMITYNEKNVGGLKSAANYDMTVTTVCKETPELFLLQQRRDYPQVKHAILFAREISEEVYRELYEIL